MTGGHKYEKCNCFSTRPRPFLCQCAVRYEQERIFYDLGWTNKLEAFIRIVLPLVSPGIVSTAIYVFINAWNEYLYAMILMSSSDKTTISVAVKTLEGADILNYKMYGKS